METIFSCFAQIVSSLLFFRSFCLHSPVACFIGFVANSIGIRYSIFVLRCVTVSVAVDDGGGGGRIAFQRKTNNFLTKLHQNL